MEASSAAPRFTTPEVGDYQLEKLLGHGSFGHVYLCRHKQSGAQACVKLEARSTTSPQINYEFRLYEAFASGPVSQFVPRPLDYGEEGDYRYLVLELGGRDLSHAYGFAVHRKLCIFVNVLHALEALHDGGLLHRDIKPKNILLKPGTPDPNAVLLIDLGLAKRFRVHGKHVPKTRKDKFVGTTRYASPYVQMYTQSSRRDDLFSLVFCMVAVFGQQLPWQDLSGDQQTKSERTLHLKRRLTPRQVCKGCPPSLALVYEHVMQLPYEARPPYELFRQLVKLDLHHCPPAKQVK